jgi:uncharacterized membrane protein
MEDLALAYKTIHIIAAIILGGGFVLEAMAGPLVARAQTVGEVRAYARMMHLSETFLSPASALILLGMGYATASRAKYDLSDTWLIAAQVIIYAMAALGLFILRPAAAKLHKLAQASPDGPVTQELRDQMAGPLPKVVGPVMTVMFIVAIYLMVFKPGLT